MITGPATACARVKYILTGNSPLAAVRNYADEHPGGEADCRPARTGSPDLLKTIYEYLIGR